MTDTTYEEAKRCFRCKEPGEKVGERPAPRLPGITRGASLHVIECRNERCRAFGTVVRTIQVNPDGTIPLTVKREKAFPAIPDLTEEVRAKIDEQLRMETHGGGELGGR